jgi:hypothetical protein
LVGKPLD